MSDVPDILPDSRLSTIVTAKGAVWSVAWGWMVPIFCANCGADGGLVPEKHVTFAFYLCMKCAEAHGAIANTYMEPDEVFWRRVHEAQMEEFGRTLSTSEIFQVLAEESHPLTKLARESPYTSKR